MKSKRKLSWNIRTLAQLPTNAEWLMTQRKKTEKLVSKLFKLSAKEKKKFFNGENYKHSCSRPENMQYSKTISIGGPIVWPIVFSFVFSVILRRITEPGFFSRTIRAWKRRRLTGGGESVQRVLTAKDGRLDELNEVVAPFVTIAQTQLEHRVFRARNQHLYQSNR